MPSIKRQSLHVKPFTISNELEEVGLRQLYDEQSKTFTYVVWDKETEEAVIIDPVHNQVKRDMTVCTNLHLVYAINTHVHDDHISGAALLRSKVGLKSIISEASGADADELIRDGDQIHFGKRFMTAIATPGHTTGCMSFLLDDGKVVITGDLLSFDRVQVQDAWALADSITHKLFYLPDDCIVLPGHDIGTCTHYSIREVRDTLMEIHTLEDFVEYVNGRISNQAAALKEKSFVCVACNMKDSGNPFHVRSLRDKVKNRWGIFG